jgi:hypothetical protein
MVLIKDNRTPQEKLDAAIRDLSRDPDIQALVKQTESGIETTKGHYGVYMALLSKFAGDPTALYVMPRALKFAGANAYGVDWAVKLIKGESY